MNGHVARHIRQGCGDFSRSVRLLVWEETARNSLRTAVEGLGFPAWCFEVRWSGGRCARRTVARYHMEGCQRLDPWFL